MTDPLYDLQSANRLINNAINALEEAPEKAAIVELLETCEQIDRYYRERFCVECDADYGEEQGTTYESGISLEFYIEADWWHDVSLALRKLRNSENEKP